MLIEFHKARIATTGRDVAPTALTSDVATFFYVTVHYTGFLV